MHLCMYVFILSKRLSDRVGGAKRRVCLRCRVEAEGMQADTNLDQGL